MDKLSEFLAALGGVPATGTGIGFAWLAYKLLERWLDHRAAATQAERQRDEAKDAADAKELEELRAMVLPLARRAEAADLLEKEVAKLERQVEARDTKISALERANGDLGIELRQSQTVSNSWALYSKYFDNDEGRAFLRRKMEEEEERKKADASTGG